MKESPNNSTSPAKKSENAGILWDSSATDLKIGILQVWSSRCWGRCVPGVQGICNKSKPFLKIQKLELVLKFLVFFQLSTNNILTFVEDFKSISVPSKEISNLEVEKIFEFLTLLSFPLVVLLCHTRSYLV